MYGTIGCVEFSGTLWTLSAQSGTPPWLVILAIILAMVIFAYKLPLKKAASRTQAPGQAATPAPRPMSPAPLPQPDAPPLPLADLLLRRRRLVNRKPFLTPLPPRRSGIVFKDRRRDFKIPYIQSVEQLAQYLELQNEKELVLLADPNQLELRPGTPHEVRNYWTRRIPKRGGGMRILFAPKPRLKAVQRRILRDILEPIFPHPAATGFRKQMDISANALPHVGQRIVAAMDLEDFFPSIRNRRVAAFFRWLGYPSPVAHALTLLCTASHPRHVTAPSWRCLPQGAPTSPALANLLCYRMDVRLSALAKKFNARYTRYADDLTFSGDNDFKHGFRKFLPLARLIIRAEGFRLHPRKFRFMRRGRLQRVTGLIVNDRLSVGRRERDRLKAILHNARKAGSLETQNRDRHEHFDQHLRGKIAWVERYHPEAGARLRKSFNAIVLTQRPWPAPRGGTQPPHRTPGNTGK